MPSTARDLNPAQRETLRGHVINLRQGRFSSDGDLITTPPDVERLFGELIPAALAEATAAGRVLRVLFFAHGGLVGEGSGVAGALTQIPFWKANGVYPIFFVWETGLVEVLADALRKALTGQRGFGDVVKEAQAKLIESVARRGGLRVWGSMKLSAQASSAPEGGALMVARLAGEFFTAHPGEVEFHACGHSAGAIFHSYFVPALIDAGGTLTSLHLLAPAVNVPTFKARLMPLSGRGIGTTTMFTMHREFERADTAGPYPKSLLYLVHHSFEDPDETAILGLEENAAADAELAQFFRQPTNEIVFSVTDAHASPRSATQSVRHGDFDNDRPTMESVCRRILGVSDVTPIADFPVTRGRDLDDLDLLARELAVGGAAVTPTTIGAGTGLGLSNTAGVGTGPAPLAAAPAIASGAGRKRIALCVGVDAYPAPDTLFGCVNDSIEWEQWFSEMQFTVSGLRNGQATREAITSSLAAHVDQLAAGDVFLFQYSGHGVQFPDQSGDEPDNKDEALCPVDMLTAGFIRDDEIREILNRVPMGALAVAFVDCCHSGSIVRMVRILDAVPGASLPRAIVPTAEMLEVHRRTRRPGRARAPHFRRDVLFAACRDDQVAFETGGHGDYTQAAIPLLRQRGAGLSNLQIQQLLQQQFGAGARQNPRLDCDEDAEARPFLEP